MKIGVAQTRPSKGYIRFNIQEHKKIINQAVSHGLDTLIFPELSLTGYEPLLANEFATDQNDPRFDDFQEISDSKKITIGIGVPTRNKNGICISMVLFQSNQSRRTYSKRYLHPDEEAFFIAGQSDTGFLNGDQSMALAICYELSIPNHSEEAFKSGAKIYIASVAKTTDGVDRAYRSLTHIASKYSMTVLMSNCVGQCNGVECVGKSSIWNKQGDLIGALDDSTEGILRPLQCC